MQIAALYDIHGNLPALEAVLDDVHVAGADHIIVGGDVVPGPMPIECIERLLDVRLPVRFIRGNGDREVLARMRGVETGTVPEPFREIIRWNADQIRAYEALLASWPDTVAVQVPDLGDVLFCHATPRNDTEIFTRLTPEERLLPVFEGVEASLVVCGHTHMQFDRAVGRIRVVNAGSVGMPFQEPGAYWLMLGSRVRLRRTTYDRDKAAERIRRTKYPQAEEFAARHVLTSPSEADTLQAFGKIDLK
jgi:putative phosphoesterase